MKTLDEVIKALDVCTQSKGCKLCPYSIYDEDGFNLYDDCPSMYNDALHYLKELQELKNTNMYIPDGYIQAKLGDKNEDAV